LISDTQQKITLRNVDISFVRLRKSQRATDIRASQYVIKLCFSNVIIAAGPRYKFFSPRRAHPLWELPCLQLNGYRKLLPRG